MSGENQRAAMVAANRISRILTAVPPNLVTEMEKATSQATDEARRRARVRTGKLRDSISGRVVVGGNYVDGEIATSVEYVQYVEYGTSDTRPDPFMRPAARKAKRDMPSHVRKAVDAAISKNIGWRA